MHGQLSQSRLRELGLRPRKGLSQSFLNDAGVARAVVRAARLDSTRDDVLEVGPGLGVLTERLVRSARRVVAVELDPLLATALQEALPDPRLTVESADVLDFDPAASFADAYVVVANLPYHITSPALRHLLGAGPPFARRLVVMVQAEVADRIAAKPGQLSSLAVSIQAQARVSIVRRVPAAAFHPRPKVDSAVLTIDPFPDAERPISRTEFPAFVSLVQAGFKQPRKQLGNSLAEGLATHKPLAVALLESVGIGASRRAQELTVAEWTTLYRAHAA